MTINNTAPLVMAGRRLVSTVEQYNQSESWALAYHGARRPHGVLEPAAAFWRRNGVTYDDGGNVVCADMTPLVPTFMALAPRAHSYGYRPNEEGGVDFYLDYEARAAFESSVGCLAVLSTADFELVELDLPAGWPEESQPGRLPELRRSDAVTPAYYIAIEYADFLALLEESPASNFDYRDAWC